MKYHVVFGVLQITSPFTHHTDQPAEKPKNRKQKNQLKSPPPLSSVLSHKRAAVAFVLAVAVLAGVSRQGDSAGKRISATELGVAWRGVAARYRFLIMMPIAAPSRCCGEGSGEWAGRGSNSSCLFLFSSEASYPHASHGARRGAVCVGTPLGPPRPPPLPALTLRLAAKPSAKILAYSGSHRVASRRIARRNSPRRNHRGEGPARSGCEARRR